MNITVHEINNVNEIVASCAYSIFHPMVVLMYECVYLASFFEAILHFIHNTTTNSTSFFFHNYFLYLLAANDVLFVHAPMIL